MDAETRKRMELRAEWQERLTLSDTKYADEHRQAAADLRATLAEIDRLTKRSSEFERALMALGVRDRLGVERG